MFNTYESPGRFLQEAERRKISLESGFFGLEGQKGLHPMRASRDCELGKGSQLGMRRVHQELVGEYFCQVTKSERVSSKMTANLSMIKNHRERIGQKANHC